MKSSRSETETAEAPPNSELNAPTIAPMVPTN